MSIESQSSVPMASPEDDFEATRIRAAVRSHFLGTPRLSVGRYQIGQSLGSGGAGSVYRAHDPVLDRDVAIKLLHRSSRRLQQEAAALASLDHPHVVAVLDLVPSSEGQAMVMELVAGVSLRAWIAAEPRTTAEVTQRFVEAGLGLAAVHAQGLVHRDFKSDNVVVDTAGRARLVDFGLVRSWKTTQAAVAEGTPRYMAPEQRRGERPHPSSDQYSFCASLRECFDDGHATVPARIDKALRRGMAEDPGDRWPDLKTLLRELQVHKSRRSYALAAGVAGVALAGIAAALLATRSTAREGGCPPTLPARLASVQLPADPKWAEVQAHVDAFVADWSTAHVAVCDAKRVDTSRVACLSDGQINFEIWTQLFEDGALVDPSLAKLAAGRLPDLEACIGPTPPESRQGGNRAARLRLARASFAWTLGNYAKAAAESEAVWQELTAAEDCPTRASAAHLHGIARQKLGEHKVALEWFDRSIVDAEGCGAYEIVAEAASRALQVAGGPIGDRDALDRYGRLAEAALHRAGNPARVLASFLGARAIARHGVGDVQGAIQDMTRALQVMETEVGSDGYELEAYASNLGTLLYASGRLDEAAAAFERAYAIVVESHGKDSAKALSLQTNLAALDASAGRHAEALTRLRQNLALHEANPDAPKRARLTTLMNLAELELSRQEFSAAKTHYQQVVDILADPTDDPAIYLAALSRLGSLAGEEGDFPEAERILARARVLGAEHAGTDSEDFAWATLQLAIVRLRQQRGADAIDLLREIETSVEASDDGVLASAYYANLAEAQLQIGSHAAAMASARRAVEQEQTDPTRHAAALFTLALIERAADEGPAAQEHGAQAHRIFERAKDPRQAEVRAWLDSE